MPYSTLKETWNFCEKFTSFPAVSYAVNCPSCNYGIKTVNPKIISDKNNKKYPKCSKPFWGNTYPCCM